MCSHIISEIQKKKRVRERQREISLLVITLCLIYGLWSIICFGHNGLGFLIFNTICALWIVDLLQPLPILWTIINQMACNLIRSKLLLLRALNTLCGHGIGQDICMGQKG